MEKSDNDTAAINNIKKIKLPDGFQVGISNLDNILKEVADLKLTDTINIRMELLKMVKACNYVVSGAENEYSSALLDEYQLRYREPGAVKSRNILEAKKHEPG